MLVLICETVQIFTARYRVLLRAWQPIENPLPYQAAMVPCSCCSIPYESAIQRLLFPGDWGRVALDEFCSAWTWLVDICLLLHPCYDRYSNVHGCHSSSDPVDSSAACRACYRYLGEKLVVQSDSHHNASFFPFEVSSWIRAIFPWLVIKKNVVYAWYVTVILCRATFFTTVP